MRCPIPKEKGNAVETVKYACTRFDPDITWQDKACAKLVKVPDIFLNKALGGIVAEAKKSGHYGDHAGFYCKNQRQKGSWKMNTRILKAKAPSRLRQ